ncbi:hypothetical protein GGR56DRAFT_663435 [Xylariaceae sp. FL0804]|nr:hypothetical protein GGR56DRAFT_663435 [Xylariaceae sp. FL0804]
MAGNPSSDANSPATSSPRPPPNRRRDKPQLSCFLCRRRKLKCDRQHPCTTCARRGFNCTYAAQQSNTPVPRNPAPRSAQPALQDRIQHLEDLVGSVIMRRGAQPARPAPAPAGGPFTPSTLGEDDGPWATTTTTAAEGGDEEDGEDEALLLQPELSSLKTSQDASPAYRDQSHWATVLDAIAGLKEGAGEGAGGPTSSLACEAEPSPDACQGIPDILLFAGCERISKDEIIAALPSRAEAGSLPVDHLISRCFEALQSVASVVHRGEFLKQYNEFWQNPHVTPIFWIGLLYSMLAIASQYQLQESHSTRERQQRALDRTGASYRYREKTVQCLVLGQYTKPKPWLIEAMIYYIATEYVARVECTFSLWLAVGVVVGVAMRMAYHRDPKHFKEISAFDVYHMDNGISAYLGMPRHPRNLLDTDFDANTTELPPSRSETEATPIIVHMSRMYGAVHDFVTSTRPSPYSHVLRLDQQLRETLDGLPPYCKPAAQDTMDSPNVIAQRIYIQMIYLKARLVLHKRFLTPLGGDGNVNGNGNGNGDQQQRYAYSRRTAVDTAMQLLRYQRVLDEETRPCASLYHIRWRLTSALYSDFLLATGVLCFHLQQQHDDGRAMMDHDGGRGDEIRQVVEKSRRIWMGHVSSDDTVVARRAIEAIDAVLPRTAAAATAGGGGGEQAVSSKGWEEPARAQSSVAGTDPPPDGTGGCCSGIIPCSLVLSR